MHTIELTDEELRLLHEALRSYLAQRPRGRHVKDAARLLGDKATP